MDRKHVFADKLELVTGFVFYKSGVIAATLSKEKPRWGTVVKLWDDDGPPAGP